jgi:hypothetical protein
MVDGIVKRKQIVRYPVTSQVLVAMTVETMASVDYTITTATIQILSMRRR